MFDTGDLAALRKGTKSKHLGMTVYKLTVDKALSLPDVTRLIFHTRFKKMRLKRLPPMWETWVQSLGQEDPLEKEMITNSSILAWRIPWTEKPGRLQSMGSQRVGHD
ncbi:hypothetical protein R6Z07F_009187 [Ovis aries]